MKNLNDLLQDADPLRHEPRTERSRDEMRRILLAAAAERDRRSPGWARLRLPIAVMAFAALFIVGLAVFGSRGGPQASTVVYAAVRFDVRLAEDHAGPGLREVRVAASDRVIYLHQDSVVTNDDIERSRVLPGDWPGRFNIGVQFTASGAEKMRQATADHLGKLLAVLIDGDVVMAPVLRSPISTSALISGDYSQAQAERIVNGIGVR